jgi:Na+-translocating ferredoxin:NAD+ oxidoreductase subunit G
MQESIVKHTVKTAGVLIVFAFLYTLLLSGVFNATKLPIEESEAKARMELFAQIVPPSSHDNDVLKDSITIAPNAMLGNKLPTVANRARMNNAPQAVILEAIAHDGYSGDIKLLIAVNFDGTISGVRVIAHKETPGLGDYIDILKGNWITLFKGESLAKTAVEKWKVKRDGGQFDYMAGATITPRAVVGAVAKTLQYVETNKTVLFAE